MVARRLLALSIALALAGCGPSPGAAGLWDLRVGGPARIVGEGGAPEIVVSNLAEPAVRGRRPRKGEAPKVETVTLAAGTKATVLAVDGDDARVRIEEGPHAGSTYWIECRRLSAGE
ncbi:MAG: hypothetical protein BGO49_04770 [Planctomycetales bacterium 71-10]|nr:MAG: hypothetical protein BGO49_04770 [Planctomycetales bacterium 71-10]